MESFYLNEGVVGGACIEISKVRFEEILRAKNIVQLCWDVEESFSLLANAFVELEEFFFKAGIRYWYQRDYQRDVDLFFDDSRQLVNLKLVSVLTASRAYEEQLLRRISTLSKLVGRELDVKEVFSEVYDNNLEYRVMYALRNHALHNRLPLSSITFCRANLSPTGVLGGSDPSRLRITVDPKISVKEFCESDRIKASVRGEVGSLGYEYLDVKFFARGFLSCLSRCHEAVRKKTEFILHGALEDLSSAASDLLKVKEAYPRHVSISRRSDGDVAEVFYVDYEQKSRIQDARSLWAGLKMAQRSYVSTELKVSNKTFPPNHDEIWISK